ncbi:MAG: DUF1330 domain-containing protein [Vicinamibacterales bacterium]
MPAYLIVDIAAVHDPETSARYRAEVSSGLEAAGGRYLVRGGAVEVLEGHWRPGHVVVVEFPSMAAARRWWESSDYEPLRRLRERSTTTHMVVVEGLPDAAPNAS